jgi:hypothetical protein
LIEPAPARDATPKQRKRRYRVIDVKLFSRSFYVAMTEPPPMFAGLLRDLRKRARMT